MLNISHLEQLWHALRRPDSAVAPAWQVGGADRTEPQWVSYAPAIVNQQKMETTRIFSVAAPQTAAVVHTIHQGHHTLRQQLLHISAQMRSRTAAGKLPTATCLSVEISLLAIES
jgi:hypothetical protein